MSDFLTGALVGATFGIPFGVVLAIAYRVWVWSGE